MITIIRDGYISCSCGGAQRYLMPCRHVCAVIVKREYYEPSMFHYLWHKIYNYYHGTEYGASTVKKMIDVLQSLLKVTRENICNDSGKFKGIFVIGSSFHRNLPPFIQRHRKRTMI